MKRFNFRRKSSISPTRKIKRGFYLWGTTLFLAGLVAGLYLFFPTDSLKNRIIREAAKQNGVALEIEQLSLIFPPGLKGDQLSIKLNESLPSPLEITVLTLKPLWTTLFTANPGISFDGNLYDGTASGKLRRDGSADIKLSQIRFDIPLAEGSSLKISGEIENAHYAGIWPPPAGAETELSLILSQTSLNGLEALGSASPNLAFGTLSLTGKGRGNSFKIESIDNEGGDLQITGNGILLLASQPENSRINMTLNLTPRASLDKALADLMTLVVKPGQDGSYRLRINGPLMKPRIN